MSTKKKQDTAIKPLSLKEILETHTIREDGGFKMAINKGGYIYIATSLDGLVKKIRNDDYVMQYVSEDTKRLGYLNMSISGWEYGNDKNGTWLSSAVGGAFTNITDCIDSMMSEAKRVDVEVLMPPKGEN